MDLKNYELKVLLVNTYDRGGAANSCKRLHRGLLEKNIDCNLLLRFKVDQEQKSFQFINKQLPYNPSLIVRAIRKLKRIYYKISGIYKINYIRNKQEKFLRERPADLEMFSLPHTGTDLTASELYEEAEIVNLHWVAGFLDLQSFFKKNKKPVVWTLHDMNPFTGGEHYKEKFLGIDDFGYPLKRTIPKEEELVSKQNIKKKKKALLRVDNLTIVAPSKWLAEEAQKSEVFKGKKIFHIPYGLDSEIFYPKDKTKSRELFNIPNEKKVILFVADSLNKNRKGFMFLIKAFELLEGKNFLLCAVGSVNSNLNIGKNILKLGTLEGESLMCAAYSAADVFVIPSLMDNMPNTVLESIMCGTPVIGFPVGGIPEMITNGKNGYITEEISVPSLHKTLVKFFNSIQIFNRENIREDAKKKYDLNIQANRYITLFKSIIGK